MINLDGEVARMAFMAEQLAALGIAFDRLQATTPDTLSPPPNDPYWSLWERPLRTTEMAAMASHRAAWSRVLEEDAPMLILEDDALLHGVTPSFLGAVAPIDEAELVSLETRGRAKLISRKNHPQALIHRLWQDRSGAAAYVLRPAGARKLLARVAKAPGLADAILCAAYDVSAWQAVPAIACQLDMCEAYGMSPPLATVSVIDSEPRPTGPKSRSQKLRRIWSQTRMGLRQLIRWPGATRLIVPYGMVNSDR
ncbi:glycosyltransferase family 25 protein [Rhodobacteraceae bacterium N5(2021)]|uniref:Glycosyltransferase family 25 protein n=1 Tax=Gymnodinialimonas phycosphaerae TaxID=2841589 RepID=A0A975YEJ7_9RHOB|nr:glycosyltransferase family 25 protein [Gymnodinialimonas phycosphaerae]